jgi:hypothetical protein
VRWPYPILVHHYDELSKFRESCAAKDPVALCIREKDMYEHLGLLLQLLDQHAMEETETEKERSRNGFVKFEGTWVALLSKTLEGQDWPPGVGALGFGRAAAKTDIYASRDFTPLPIGADISKPAFWM